MKILHTSDWHLGRSLYGRRRYEEFNHFLDWLAETIESEQVDALLVAGDIFDTTTPGNRAQALYYRFLARVAGSCCRDIVIIGGNHDSPSFLDAPGALLQALNVHVVGAMPDAPREEIIVLGDPAGLKSNSCSAAVVCAVPYLRDRDIRSVEAGESLDDKNRKLLEGIRAHYAVVGELAQQTRAGLLEEIGDNQAKNAIPIIVMGHLFTAGGETVDGDGVRELYVGSLALVGAEMFPSCADYVALGHLHVPQQVGGQEHFRYSGSPIPMGFGEAHQEKSVVLVDFAGGRKPKITLKTVPSFQPLERIAGSIDEIRSRLEALKQEDSFAWLEIEYTGREIVPELRELLDEMLEGSRMEVRRVRNRQFIEQVIGRTHEEETLDELNIYQVFDRCLDTLAIPDDQREELTAAYGEIVSQIQEEDINEL